MKYIIRRVTHSLYLIIGISLLVFVLTQLAPGDFFEEMRMNPRVAPETVNALRKQFGMEQALPIRYFRWARSALKGDLGVSLAYNSPVTGLIWPRVCNTLFLASIATAVSWLIALPLGIWSAARRGGWLDRICVAATSTLLAIPDLVLALVLLMLAVRSGRFPAGGMFSARHLTFTFWGSVRDLGAHLVLPASTLVLGTLPILVRHVRASTIEMLDAPFVRTAIAFGIPRRRLLWRHVLPPAANPLISLFGVSVGTLLSASLLIEVVMGWPGLGPLVLEAILARDLYLVIGAVMFSTLFLIGGSLIGDMLLYATDPRIRKE